VHLRTRLGNVALALASAVATLLLCEGFVAFWVKTHPRLGQAPDRLLRSHPPPYKTSPYYSIPFVEEQEFRGGTFSTPPNSDLVLVKDAQGNYINNVGGHRVTTDVPEGARQRIFVFGGSTVYGAEVPDPFTIPSYLQRLANKTAPGRYAVVNAGASSVNAAQQVALVRANAPAADDVVVFYDGINDLLQGAYYRAAGGTITAAQRLAYLDMNAVQRGVVALEDVPFLRRSYLLTYALAPFAYGVPPPHLRNQRTRARLLEQTAQVFLEDLRRGEALSRSFGARFVHFLQPQLFSAPLRTRYEQDLAANPRIVFGGYREIFSLGQVELRRCCGARLPGIASFDLSDTFSAIPPTEDVFLDAMHVTELANRLAAQAIFQGVFGGAAPPGILSAEQIDSFHREDRESWDRFVEARDAKPARVSAVSLLQNGDFAGGIAPWDMAVRLDLADGRYPKVTEHNFLRQELQSLAPRMQIDVTAGCAGRGVVRVYVMWSDASGMSDRGVDRFAFDCATEPSRSRFGVRRRSGAERASVVIDAPTDDAAVVVYRAEAHPLLADAEAAPRESGTSARAGSAHIPHKE
jgi:hypothetical protein